MKNIISIQYNGNEHCTYLKHHNTSNLSTDEKPVAFLKRICLMYGATYEGRKESFAKITGAKQKLPICVSVRERIIFIPLISEENTACSYIQYAAIKKVRTLDYGILVEFTNGTCQAFECSPKVLKKQMERCQLYLDTLWRPDDIMEYIKK